MKKIGLVFLLACGFLRGQDAEFAPPLVSSSLPDRLAVGLELILVDWAGMGIYGQYQRRLGEGSPIFVGITTGYTNVSKLLALFPTVGIASTDTVGGLLGVPAGTTEDFRGVGIGVLPIHPTVMIQGDWSRWVRPYVAFSVGVTIAFARATLDSSGAYRSGTGIFFTGAGRLGLDIRVYENVAINLEPISVDLPFDRTLNTFAWTPKLGVAVGL